MGQFEDVSKSVIIARYKKLNSAHQKAQRERDDLRKQNKRLREENKQILADNEDLTRLREKEAIDAARIRQLERQLEGRHQELASMTLTNDSLRRDLELAGEAATAHRSALASFKEVLFEQWGVMEDQVQFAMQNMLEKAKLVTDGSSTGKDCGIFDHEMPPLVPSYGLVGDEKTDTGKVGEVDGGRTRSAT